MNTTIARYALGVACLGIICLALGTAAVALRRRFFRGWTGSLARLTELVLALALLVFTLEVVGAIGLFKLTPITVACAGVGFGVPRAVGGRGDSPRRVAQRRGFAATGRRTPGLVALITGIVITATVAAEYASPTLQAYDIGVHVLDSIWYHLPLAASFAQTGHVTPPRFDVEFLTAFYPATSELLHGLGIVLLSRDTLTPVLNVLLIGPTLLAAWCIGKPRGAAVTALCGVALVLATPMMVFSQAGSADNDILGVFFFLAAVALLAGPVDHRAAYVLAAISAGFAISVRLTLLAPVLALTVGVIAIAPRGGRRAAAAGWTGPLVLAGGYWFVRNLIVVGNPAPWASFGILPTPAPPLQAHVGYAVAHYLGDSRVWDHFWEPALASGLGPWWYLIVAAAVLGPLLCLASGPDRTSRMLALVSLVSLGAYLVTPESAMGPAGDPVGIAYNLRYAAPGLTLGLALLTVAPPLAGVRRQAGLTLALIAALVATIAQGRLWPERHVAGAVAVGVVVAGLGVITLLSAARSRPRFALRSVPARAALIAAAVLLLLTGAAAGYAWQRHYLRGRYAFKPHVSHLAGLWALFRTIHHARVGLAGTFGVFFSYPLLGVDDSDRVDYIAHHGPHGSFTPIGDCREWRAAVNSADVRYLVTTPARDPFRPKILNSSPEGSWTRSDPAAHLVFARRELGQPVDVFELSGPLDPGSCR